jgi:hypothetical protein
LIHPTNGEINLDFDFGGPSGWQPGKHWAISLLMSIKKMIHLAPYYKLDGKSQLAYNKEALNSFNNQFEDDFVEKCKACVQSSQEDKYKEDKSHQPSLLQFHEWDPIHDVVSDKINA